MMRTVSEALGYVVLSAAMRWKTRMQKNSFFICFSVHHHPATDGQLMEHHPEHWGRSRFDHILQAQMKPVAYTQY